MKLDVVDKTEIEVDFNVGDNRISLTLVNSTEYYLFKLRTYINSLRIYKR